MNPVNASYVAVNDFARELHELMKRRNVSNAELARRLGVERQYIGKLLGGANVTLQTMVKLAVALDGVVRVRLEQREEPPRVGALGLAEALLEPAAAVRAGRGSGAGNSPRGRGRGCGNRGRAAAPLPVVRWCQASS